MAVEYFDVLVIGGGKGGKTLAADLASAGMRVAMVERGLIGGSCINVACIPTKTIVRQVTVSGAQPAAAKSSLSVGDIYRRAYRGVVEITVSTTASDQFGFGGSQTQKAQGSGWVPVASSRFMVLLRRA